MPLTRETTVAGVRLVKHDGDAYHYYRGSVQGYAVTVRPTLNSSGRPDEWNAYAEIDGAEVLAGYGNTLRHAVAGAVRHLKRRREREWRRS